MVVETYSDYKTVRQFVPISGEAAKALTARLEEAFLNLDVLFRKKAST